MTFWKGAWGIRFECRQFHRSSPTEGNLVSGRHRALLFRWTAVWHFEKIWNFIPHPYFMVSVTRLMVRISRRGMGIFLFTTASRTALGPNQLPIQWVPGALSLGVKRLYLHSPNMPLWRGDQLKNKQEQQGVCSWTACKLRQQKPWVSEIIC
jgi:hypothetical protein